MGTTLLDGARVLGRHWPALAGVFFIGAIGRMLFLWLAVWTSQYSATAAIFVLPLAPLSTLVALVLMLRVTAETLPAFSNLFAALPARARWTEHLTVAAQMLLPFLAVYASQGLLAEDTKLYLVDVTMDDVMNSTIPMFQRTVYAEGSWLVVAVVIALVLRKVLSATGLAEKSLAGSGFAAYFEALWLVTFAHALAEHVAEVGQWIRDRAVIDAIFNAWTAFVETTGWLGRAVGAFVDGLGAFIANSTYLLTIPIAWLTIGAAVYGKDAVKGFTLPTTEERDRERQKDPNAFRRVAKGIVDPLLEPFENTLKTIKVIIRAGLIPMLLFCVVFIVLHLVQAVVQWTAWLIVGPRTSALDFAIAPFIDLATRLIYFVIAMSLVAAGVNGVVMQLRARTDDATPARAVVAE